MYLYTILSYLILALVWSLPAKATPTLCRSILPEQLQTFEGLKNTILDCKMKDIGDLLESFHDNVFSGSALIFGSRSLQDASFANPRILLRVGSLVVAYNGNPSQKGFFDLETMEFNKVNSSFELRSIHFPETKSGEIIFSETNPTKCLACHGQDPRPNWNSYIFWPGLYGGEDDFLSPAEVPFYKKFIATKDQNKRYSKISDYAVGEHGNSHWEPLFHFSRDFTYQNNFRIGRKIKEDSKLKPYFYTVLAAATCSDEKTDVRQFLSKEAQKTFVADYDQIYRDTVEANVNMAYHDRQLQKKFKGSYMQNDRVVESYKGGGYSYQDEEVPIVAGLRYLVEGLGGQTKDWSMEFGFRSYRFEDGLGGIIRLKFYLKDLLDPVKDKELYQLYDSFSLGSQSYDWDEKSKIRACEILKGKSLDQRVMQSLKPQ